MLAASPAPAEGENGMVVTAQHLATDVGIEVLKAGGNAVDAAVAVGYALAVTYPTAGNLGGGGFMTIRLADGTSRFLDFRERRRPPPATCISTTRASRFPGRAPIPISRWACPGPSPGWNAHARPMAPGRGRS